MMSHCGARIRRWVQQKLVGRQPNAVGFVDELLHLGSEVGEIRCTLAADHRLRFLIPNQQSIVEAELDAAKGKLRMLCARLGVLCNESGDQDVSLYGGEGFIKEGFLSPTNPNGLPVPRRLAVRFKNTPSQQEFTITAE